MAEETVLTWNAANWVSVVLMALIAFTLLGLLQKYMQGKINSQTSASG